MKPGPGLCVSLNKMCVLVKNLVVNGKLFQKHSLSIYDANTEKKRKKEREMKTERRKKICTM